MTKEKKDLTVNQKRILSRCEKEIRKIVFDIERKEQKGCSSYTMLPISSCEIDRKFQVLKIFLSLNNNKQDLGLVSEINRKFSSLTRSELAKKKIFPRVPKVLFAIDRHFDYIEKIEKILKEN